MKIALPHNQQLLTISSVFLKEATAAVSGS